MSANLRILERITNDDDGLEAVIYLTDDAGRPWRAVCRDVDAAATVAVVDCLDLVQAQTKGREFAFGKA